MNISTKELNYINDLLSWELLSAKKCYQYACQESTTSYNKLFMDAANTHQSNYLNLLNYISQVQNQKGGQVQ